VFETQVAGVRMRAPMMSIHTVAAGGGSILHFDGSRYRVGPDSAGANPGPASYRRGGPLTVTDCNVMLGKIQPRTFPHLFGRSASDQPLDLEAVRAGFAALAGRSAQPPARRRRRKQVAEGFIQIAVGNMANAIKQISVQRGHDVTEYTLTSFGGAGGQHACLVADALGMKTVFIHSLAGRAVGLRHGPGRPDRDARGAVERRLGRFANPNWRRELDALGRAGARGAAGTRAWRRPHRTAAPRAPALRGHRFGARGAVRPRMRPCRRQFEAPTASAFPSSCRARRWWSKRCRSRRSGSSDAPAEQSRRPRAACPA
jgi:5-oxoprolinase (ATP-hydrolysing)